MDRGSFCSFRRTVHGYDYLQNCRLQ